MDHTIKQLDNLFDDRGYCRICSTSLVLRKFDNPLQHARDHKAAGDPVAIYYAAGVRSANSVPTIFKITHATENLIILRNGIFADGKQTPAYQVATRLTDGTYQTVTTVMPLDKARDYVAEHTNDTEPARR